MSNALKAFSTDPFWVRIPSFPTAKFQVRRLGNKRLAVLRKEHSETTYDKRTHQPKEELNYDAFFNAKAQEQVLGWEGLEIQGEAIPFSKENLEGLCEFHVGLVAEVMGEAERIDPILAEEREKNSSPGGSGKSKA